MYMRVRRGSLQKLSLRMFHAVSVCTHPLAKMLGTFEISLLKNRKLTELNLKKEVVRMAIHVADGPVRPVLPIESYID